MFLTKKGQRKAVIFTVCYAILGCISIVIGAETIALQIPSPSLYLGIVVLLLSPVVYIGTRYIEGVSKLTSLGEKMIYKELRPADFLKHYEDLKNAPDLVVKKPSPVVLGLVAVAHSCLNNQDATLVSVDELLSIASKKKMPLVKLTKASYLYDFGMIEEAEALFTEVQQTKMDALSRLFADMLWKSDRARATGDYKTAECFYLQKLSQTFPKPTNLVNLIHHSNLGEVYEKLNEPDKAIPHYQYCVDHGGETAIKESAKEALVRLQ